MFIKRRSPPIFAAKLQCWRQVLTGRMHGIKNDDISGSAALIWGGKKESDNV